MTAVRRQVFKMKERQGSIMAGTRRKPLLGLLGLLIHTLIVEVILDLLSIYILIVVSGIGFGVDSLLYFIEKTHFYVTSKILTMKIRVYLNLCD